MAAREPQQFAAGSSAETMLIITVSLMSIMAAVDMTIVTSALPYMQGSLDADANEITWVVTMFVIGQAIAIGITGHLAKILGRRRLAIISVLGFIVLSGACAISQSIDQMVVFRFFQGLLGAPLIPLSQSIIISQLQPERRVRALGFWALGVMSGPAVGPALGGFFAETLDWRWNFWVNFPIGALATVLIFRFIPRTQASPAPTDWVGITLLSLMIIPLQIVLDQGNLLDWFSSPLLVGLAIVALGSGVAFVTRGIALGERNIIQLNLFAAPNFAICSVLICLIGSYFLAMMILLPSLMVDELRWEVLTAGLVIGAGGVAGAAAALMSPHLMRLAGPRVPIILAFLLVSVGLYRLSNLNSNTSPFEIIMCSAVAQFGVMLGFTPINAVGLGSLPGHLKDQGAGLFNGVKTLGFSFGTTIIATLLYRGHLANWTILGGEVSPTNPGYSTFFNRMPFSEESEHGRAVLEEVVAKHAGMVTAVETCQILAISAVICVPLAFLIRTNPGTATHPPGASSAHPAPLPVSGE